MKTRKLYTALALFCAIILASCTKDWLGQKDGREDLILFRPASGTRAVSGGIIQNTIFPKDHSFSMNAFVLPLNEQGQPQYVGGSIFMIMETVSYTTDRLGHDPDSAWRTSAHHYWPVSGCCYFVAIHPTFMDMVAGKVVDATSLAADSTGNMLIKDYRIKHTDLAGNPVEVDSLKTDSNLSNAGVDFMTSSYVITDVTSRASNSVPMAFTHNLTQMRFSIETDKDYSSRTLAETDSLGVNWYWTHWQQFWIDEIELTNIYSKGTYSLSSPHWPSTGLKELYTYWPLRREEEGGTQAMYLAGASEIPSDDLESMLYFGTRTPVANYVKDRDGDILSILLIPQRVPSKAQIRAKVCSRSLTMLTRGEESLSTLTGHIMNDETFSFYKTFNLSELQQVLVGGTCLTVRFRATMDSISCGVDYSDWKGNENGDVQQ